MATITLFGGPLDGAEVKSISQHMNRLYVSYFEFRADDDLNVWIPDYSGQAPKHEYIRHGNSNDFLSHTLLTEKP